MSCYRQQVQFDAPPSAVRELVSNVERHPEGGTFIDAEFGEGLRRAAREEATV